MRDDADQASAAVLSMIVMCSSVSPALCAIRAQRSIMSFAERCGGFEIDLSQYGLIDFAEYDDSKLLGGRHVECSAGFCNDRCAFWPIVRRNILILVRRKVET